MNTPHRPLALAVLLSGLCTFVQARELLVATDYEKRGGYLEVVTMEALKRQGYQIKIEYMPWARALRLSMDFGAYDILLGAYLTRERQAKMAYSDPIGQAEHSLFALRLKKIRYTSVSDLAPLSIGKIRDAAVSDAFDKANLPGIEEVTSIEQNIKKLQAGRIDAFVDKKRTTLHILQTQFADFADQVEAIEPPLQVDYFYNAFPKSRPDHQKLLADFNRGLRAIKKDGTYDAILKKHPSE